MCVNPDCAIKLNEQHKREAYVKAIAGEKKTKPKRAAKAPSTLAEMKKRVEYWCNRYIRLRDKDEPCISCGNNNPRTAFAAGHYRTVKAAGQLRYNEDNIHKQCNYYCNQMLSGNITAYRANLIKKIGIDRVEALENNHKEHHYTVAELVELEKMFKQKIKALGGK